MRSDVSRELPARGARCASAWRRKTRVQVRRTARTARFNDRSVGSHRAPPRPIDTHLVIGYSANARDHSRSRKPRGSHAGEKPIARTQLLGVSSSDLLRDDRYRHLAGQLRNHTPFRMLKSPSLRELIGADIS